MDTLHEVEELFEQAAREVTGSQNSWQSRNAGRARVGARRAAGMAIRAWLLSRGQSMAGYGTNFMHHLAGVADDHQWPVELRESAWRLAARKVPAEGFQTPLPDPLEPATDAFRIINWFRMRTREGSEG